MPKIISKRGRPEHAEVDIELDLGELEGETIVVTNADATEDGQLVFEYYKEDWVIQLEKLGCYILHNEHEQIVRIFYRGTEVAMVTETAIQSGLDTVIDYVRDTIDFINSVPK